MVQSGWIRAAPLIQVGKMKVHQDVIATRTKGRGFHDVTEDVTRIVASAGIQTGLCVVFIKHTSASLLIQENADPSVQRDLDRWMSRLCPEDAKAYEHDDEGIDDMPAHLRSAMTRTSESIPITNGRLALGTWQALYLWEHRRAPHTRSCVVHIQGI